LLYFIEKKSTEKLVWKNKKMRKSTLFQHYRYFVKHDCLAPYTIHNNNYKCKSCVMISKIFVKPDLWILIWIISMMIILSACGRSTDATATCTLDGAGRISSPEKTLQADLTTGVTPNGEGMIEQNFKYEPAFGYTYHSPDGNRLVQGAGALPHSMPVDVPLKGVPEWIAAAQDGDASMWAVVLRDGEVQAFALEGGDIREIDITPERLPPGAPPLLKVQGGKAEMVNASGENASPLSHPAVLDPSGELLAYIDLKGDVVIQEHGEEMDRLKVNALPDARLIVDEGGNILALSDPTRRYDHNVLGDDLEASSITLIETKPEPVVVIRILVDEPAVIEGVAPIWVDLNADGEREIIVTRSDANRGARLVVYDNMGKEIAAGPAIGQGYRWRNQLGAAPFDDSRRWDLVDVLTPHLTGVVEFYKLDGENMEIKAQVRGYTSHVIGTRNLDMGLMGDFDGDQIIEALLPNQSRTELGAIERSESGAFVDWSLPAGGAVSSNLAAVTTPDGKIILGVGRQDRYLRIWLP
jgi:hypothetical protein